MINTNIITGSAVFSLKFQAVITFAFIKLVVYRETANISQKVIENLVFRKQCFKISFIIPG